MMLSRCRALTSSSSAVHRVLGTATVNSFLPTLVNHHRPLGRSSHITVPLTAAFSTSLSSFTEPNPTLFRNRDDDGSLHSAAIPTAIKDDVDAQLRHDIRVLGSLLGQIIQEHDDDPNDNEANGIFAKVEFLRHHAKRWRASGKQTLHELADYCSTFTDRELFLVARAFTHFLALANAAETHHRARRLQAADASGALHAKPDSCGGVLPALIARGVDPDVIYQALTTQTTELVLTAHPTEVNRRTILEKKRRIQELLKQADLFRATGASSFAANELNKAMRAEIASIWQSDEVARTKPSPETEAEKGTLVVETVLWKTLPLFLRKLDATCQEFLNKSLPLDAAPIRFASWMGGDRDGNPNVKPTTTRKVCMKNRAKAAKLFAQDLVVLRNKLSITTCSSEIRAIVGDDVREPYRAFLKPMIEKMERTVEWAEHELANLEHNRTGSSGDAIPANEIYLNKEEFKEKLMMIRQSLYDSGNEAAADGLLTDVLRNLSSFGLTLIPLDVRQESERHEEAVDAITRFLGLGSYSQWDESSKINWLTTQISSKRPLIRPGVWREHPDIFSETAVDTLEIFEMIKDQHEDSLGAYVISQATTASDVLAVLLLQLDAGVKKPLRIAPLFETLADLQGAADTMKSLFSLPVYMGIINGKQEVMIGYSDSAKDAGRLAASWAQFETQESLAKIAREYSVDMTFFHGKGGTVGRGGNPQTFTAIVNHPPATINGQFRVTEQGEMINQNFGYDDRAERTMDIYTAAVLSERLVDRPTPTKEWRDMMATLSDISCDAYRKVILGDERFVPYFRSATPEQELTSLNIGSRPAKRKATGGVESLRAIPYHFAWTQTRFNLPTWLGVGEAIGETLKGSNAPLLREMYKEWGSFRTTVDLVEMVLSKSEPAIAKHYEDMLVHDEKAVELGKEVRDLHVATEQAVLDLTEHTILGENNYILQRALNVRNPYVDCLNVLQAEALTRVRKGDADKDLKDALMTTITGIANGMGNTG